MFVNSILLCMTSSVCVLNKDIYISTYNWFCIRWLLLTVDLRNEINEMKRKMKYCTVILSHCRRNILHNINPRQEY